jgi:hypothetical protein
MRALPNNYIDPLYFLVDGEEELGGQSKKHINIANGIPISIRSICKFSIKLSKK